MTDQAIAIPVLASLDLAQSKHFYEEKLGFTCTNGRPRHQPPSPGTPRFPPLFAPFFAGI